jgi:hypothetical protein
VRRVERKLSKCSEICDRGSTLFSSLNLAVVFPLLKVTLTFITLVVTGVKLKFGDVNKIGLLPDGVSNSRNSEKLPSSHVSSQELPPIRVLITDLRGWS